MINFKIALNRLCYRSRVNLPLNSATAFNEVVVPKKVKIKADRVYLKRNTVRMLTRIESIRKGQFSNYIHSHWVAKGISKQGPSKWCATAHR